MSYSFSEFHFKAAFPVWERGEERALNRTVIFRKVLPKTGKATLYAAGHGNYAIRVNGAFIAFGPARCAHGFFRVDEIPLDGLLEREENVVTLTVCGSGCTGFYITSQPAFLCAEILSSDGKVLAATGTETEGKESFELYTDLRRTQKCQKYNTARTFCEIYTFGKGYDSPEKPGTPDASVCLPAVPARQCGRVFLRRNAPYPDYETDPAEKITLRGKVVLDRSLAPKSNHLIDTLEDGKIMGYTRAEMTEIGSDAVSRFVYSDLSPADCPLREDKPERISSGAFSLFAFEGNLTGFIRLRVTAEQDTDLYGVYDEIVASETAVPDYSRLTCVNVIVWHLSGGQTYELDSREMYTLQYLMLASLGGDISVEKVALTEYAYPGSTIGSSPDFASFPASDREIAEKVFRASVSTFRQNAADIFMDCPSRERGGWLCDSFFTGRTEKALTGENRMEREYLENFLLPDVFPDVPYGMIPMCYPADHRGRLYIPNWAMWFVLEVYDYGIRSGDREFWTDAKDRIYALMEFFRKYENADGLLEKLDGWIFIEWSRSNDLVQDISYPSNMVYLMVKAAVGQMYGDKKLTGEAERLKKLIRERSLTESGFFCDNSVYDEKGNAVLSGECTETCQYYAFASGVADREKDGALWKKLLSDFGPERVDAENKVKTGGKYPEIAPANTFIGLMLRLLILSEAGEDDVIAQNVSGYFGMMAERTGTIWENQTPTCSCCHGFASYIAAVMTGSRDGIIR